MKPGGNRPPGDNPLFLSISGTGSFICPVAESRLDIPRPLITESPSPGGKPRCSVPRWDSNRQHIGPESNALPTGMLNPTVFDKYVIGTLTFITDSV